jgi:hypothetical protein
MVRYPDTPHFVLYRMLSNRADLGQTQPFKPRHLKFSNVLLSCSATGSE